MSQAELDARVSRCSQHIAESRAWPHRRAITHPHHAFRLDALGALYRSITGETLTPEAIRWSTVDFGSDSLDEAFIGEDGEGVLRLSRPRGFMPGMGQTLTYHLVTREVCAEFEDFWEDNIGEVDRFEFELRAQSEDALDRVDACVRETFTAETKVP